MRLLSNITAVKIRGTYSPQGGNNNLRLFDCRHTAQSNTTNIHHAGQDTQQPPRRAALYTEGLSGKRQATNGAQRLINRT